MPAFPPFVKRRASPSSTFPSFKKAVGKLALMEGEWLANHHWAVATHIASKSVSEQQLKKAKDILTQQAAELNADFKAGANGDAWRQIAFGQMLHEGRAYGLGLTVSPLRSSLLDG